ncbi:MAG TPA: hypothetical protein VFC07_09600 [Verrucomicrobiae bacterium]|nr:hypothetical protein [Verrucomicrobiae bacterium]
MKQRFRSILAIVQAGTMAVLMVASASCQNSQTPGTNAQAKAFLDQLELKSPPYWQSDTKGNLIKVWLSWKEANDTNLALLSTVGSIQELGMRPQRHGLGGLTREGFSSLKQLTNLTKLNVGCIFEMPPGMFEEICQLKGLRSLTLYGAFPPKKAEYENLKRLTNLEELRMSYCANFGGQELGWLTNLTHLKSLELPVYSGSKADTNVLSCLKNLTNLDVQFWKK